MKKFSNDYLNMVANKMMSGKSKPFFKEGDRVHLKGTSHNGQIKKIIKGEKFPLFLIDWDRMSSVKFYAPRELAIELKKD